MKISIIIPTYKPDDYIFECLDSLYNQTLSHSDYEIVIVLNGCSEPWQSKIEKYIINKMSGCNTKFIQTDVGGVSNARNIALSKATGEYITFIDDDDYVSSEYLDELYRTATPTTVALSDALSFEDSTQEFNVNYGLHKVFINLYNRNNISLFFARKMFGGPTMKLIHRNIIGDRTFETEFSNGEDSLFMFLISDKIKNIKFTSSKAIYFRRIRNNSATTREKKLIYILHNRLRMCIYYTKYYLRNPIRYNIWFLLSMYAAALKTILYKIFI